MAATATIDLITTYSKPATDSTAGSKPDTNNSNDFEYIFLRREQNL